MELSKAGAPVNGVSEVQRITPTGVISGGDFTITYGGQVTAPIAWDAGSAAIQAALEALSNVAPDEIVVTGGPINAAFVTLTFGGTLGGLNVGQVTVDTTNLTGAAPVLTPTTITGGVSGSFRGAPAGAWMEDTTNAIVYRNSGTSFVPIWTVEGPRSTVDSRYDPPIQPHGPYVDAFENRNPIRLG